MPYASPSASTTTITNAHDDAIHTAPVPVVAPSPQQQQQRGARLGGHRRSYSSLPHFPIHHSPSPSPSPEPGNQQQQQHANTAAFSPLAGIPRRATRSPAPKFDFPSSVQTVPTADAPSEQRTTTTAEVHSQPTTPIMRAAAGLRVDTNLILPSPSPDAEAPAPAGPAEDAKKLGVQPIPFPQLSPEPPAPAPAASASGAAGNSAIPFPQQQQQTYSAFRPASGASTPMRSPSSPIIRKSNGTIVKPSLKSSLSSSNIPALNSPTSSSSAPIPSNTTTSARNFTRSAPSTPSIKAVHFTEKDSVVLFEKTQRPVAVSLTSGQNPGAIKGVNLKGGESETETEREGDGVLGLFGVSLKGGMDRGYPFPASTYSASAAAGLGLSTGKEAGKDVPRIEIAKAKSSDVPSVPGLIAPKTLQESSQKVHLESAVLASPTSTSSADGEKGDEILKGTILVENVAFGKSVYIRFTLDDWQTTSEVGANWVCSLPALAPAGSSSSGSSSLGFSSHGRDRSKSEPALSSMGSSSSEAVKGRQFDRFSFSINLSSIRSLHTRRLFAVVRFQPHGWNEEFWDNANGENYRFVFERAVPSSVSSTSPKKVGLGLSSGERERRSSMPVSPGGEKASGVGKRFIKLGEVGDRDESADEEEVARKEKERLLALARERPVPRLPGVNAMHHLHGLGGMEKSASAPSLAHHHASMHHAQNMHSLPFPASIAKSNVHSHHHVSQSLSSSQSSSPPSNDEANRARSGSASNYPAIHLRLSNYISPTSPTVKSPFGSRTSSASSSDFIRPPSIDTVAQNGKGAAPLSPPASPVADKRASPAPSPPRSQSPTRAAAAVVSDNASFSSLTLAPSQTQSQSQQSQPRSITPPESANTSPEPSQVPLPLSQSSSSNSNSNTSSSPSNSSDSDRDNLRLAFSSPHHPKAHHIGNGPGTGAGGNYYKRSMTHSPEYHASQQAARMANRAPVPRGLDFAARLSMSGLGVNGSSTSGGGEESMGDAHAGVLHGSSHGHHHHHHHHHPVQHQAKFTLGGARSAHGGSNSSSPVSSSTSTPVGVMSPASGTQSPVHTAPAAAPSTNGLASQLGVVGSSNSALNLLAASSASQSHSGTNSPNPFNNAPPEFLQKFCFFGSPEPSPTHTHSQPFGSVVGSPVMLGAEVVPGALLAGGRQAEYLGAYSPMFGQQRVQ